LKLLRTRDLIEIEEVRLAAEVRRGLKLEEERLYLAACRQVRLAAEVRRGLKQYDPRRVPESGSPCR